MPSPLELLLDPISLAIFGLFFALALAEWAFPGRDLPRVRGWWARGLVSFAAYFFLSSYLPLLWDEHLAAHRVVDLTHLPAWLAAVIGVLVYEAFAYAYHRALHTSPWLWRNVHQMHHSAERLDTAGAFFFSPLDMIGWTAVGSLALVWIVGLPPQAATIALMAITFFGIFQHANLRTPRWLGYLIQRPESHTRHHGRDHHKNNYADLPIFDLLFGTFENPEHFEGETGLYDGASAQLKDMLLGRDLVAERRREPATASASHSSGSRPSPRKGPFSTLA